MNSFYKWTLAFGVSIVALVNTAFAADQCTLDVYDIKFKNEVRKLAIKNNKARQNFDSLKDNFGLHKMAVDLADNMQAGKYVEELKFIHSWKDTDKAISLNTKSANFSQWQTKISPAGQPSIISDLGKTMKGAGDTLLGLSLAVNAYDAFTGDEKASKAAAVDIYKFAMGEAAAKYGSQTLGLALVGVSFMDYALNQYMKTAYVKYEDYWWEGYDKYLKRTYTRSSWARLYSTKGQAGVDARLREFWKNAYLEVGTHNQGKNSLATAADALALVDYPEPFAARYMTETLAPGLKQYYADKAADAEMDMEMTLMRSCDRLMRQMGEVETLKKVIDAARVEIDLRAKQGSKDKIDAEDADAKAAADAKAQADAEAIIAKYRQYIYDGMDNNTLILPLNMSAEDAFKIGMRDVDAGLDFYAAIDYLGVLGRQQALEQESNSKLALPQIQDMLEESAIPTEPSTEIPTEKSAIVTVPTSLSEPSTEPKPLAGYNDGAGNKDLLALLPDYLAADERGELSAQGKDELAYLLRIQKNVQDNSTANPTQEEASDDDWGDVDEIDGVIYSVASEEEKWIIRDKMAAQQAADQARSDALAGQSYVAIEQQRAEEAQIREEKRRQFAAAMQEISAGLTQAAAQIREADQQSSAAIQQNNQAYNNIFNQANEQNLFMNKCIASIKPTPGFPTLDPNANRMACADKYRRNQTGGSKNGDSYSELLKKQQEETRRRRIDEQQQLIAEQKMARQQALERASAQKQCSCYNQGRQAGVSFAADPKNKNTVINTSKRPSTCRAHIVMGDEVPWHDGFFDGKYGNSNNAVRRDGKRWCRFGG